ncbi:MAG: hypothetical protein MK180_15575 [Rhodobacteraceae bacterium]|nr:hypothetical protein [Paracoccaceae bacterium]
MIIRALRRAYTQHELFAAASIRLEPISGSFVASTLIIWPAALVFLLLNVASRLEATPAVSGSVLGQNIVSLLEVMCVFPVFAALYVFVSWWVIAFSARFMNSYGALDRKDDWLRKRLETL